MNWLPLSEPEQLDSIVKESFTIPLVLFKHSIRCSISAMAKSRLERSIVPEGLPFYYIDLIHYRPLSNAIAQRFGVQHESPQVLLISKGECIYEESHNGIDMDEINEQYQLALSKP